MNTLGWTLALGGILSAAIAIGRMLRRLRPKGSV